MGLALGLISLAAHHLPFLRDMPRPVAQLFFAVGILLIAWVAFSWSSSYLQPSLSLMISVVVGIGLAALLLRNEPDPELPIAFRMNDQPVIHYAHVYSPHDQLVITFPEARIANTSATKLVLDIDLHVTSTDGRDIKLRSGTRLSGGRDFGKHTNQILDKAEVASMVYLNSPLSLDPGQTTEGQCVFIYPDLGKGQEASLLRANSQYFVTITDVLTGKTRFLHLPTDYRG